ncbi:transcription antitermination factor NusB [Protaetiibacter intestinalis]|uniref:Transcription antitermination protein NusB n=1 Tax=Protaetiibacter intestinalis TaxID=2419774 RepID=A0A387BKS3_9MICO|nr:transcription antitermination factor NusB [Protaetiibacter intestinalis]AYF99110.1 transcription antitermination factor NusB [Protaetiibacter intestinalis]
MSSRTKARKRAVDILYSADLRERALADALVEESQRAAQQPAREGSWVYAREIVSGVDAHLAELDAAITAHAHGWTLERMPVLDRAIIRVGAWEILHNDEVPDGVAISEAVQLAAELSTDDSGGFVNGVLSAIARDR